MSVQRFRDGRHMPRVPIVTAAPLEERIAAAWDRAHLRGSTLKPRGVQRFRDVESAQAARTALTLAFLRSLK